MKIWSPSSTYRPFRNAETGLVRGLLDRRTAGLRRARVAEFSFTPDSRFAELLARPFASLTVAAGRRDGQGFKGVAYDQLRTRLDGVLPDGFEVCRTPPSSAVRASVKPIMSTEPFTPQADAARAAFRAVEALLISDLHIEPAAHLTIGVLGKADRAGRSDPFQSRGDVDAIPIRSPSASSTTSPR